MGAGVLLQDPTGPILAEFGEGKQNETLMIRTDGGEIPGEVEEATMEKGAAAKIMNRIMVGIEIDSVIVDGGKENPTEVLATEILAQTMPMAHCHQEPARVVEEVLIGIVEEVLIGKVVLIGIVLLLAIAV
jgi:hypothetical protein